MDIVSLARADVAAAGAVLDAAFGRTGMTQNLQYYYGLQPENWFCAKSAAKILGLVGAIVYDRFASIGMMAVHPAVQRQSLGWQLMARLVGHLEGRGCQVLLLDASAAGQHLYPKLGFAGEGYTVRAARAYDGACREAPAAPGHATVREMTASDLRNAAAFDAPIFGANRSAVIRSLLSRYTGMPGRAYIAEDAAGRTAGYVMAGPASIGPWCAASLEVAEGLLVAALGLSYEDGPRLTVPDANTAGRELLARYGFVEIESLLHMRRGGTADPRQPGHIYAQASLMLG